MNKLKEEHMPFLDDAMYTPIHYKGIIVKQPFYQGTGNHSISQLEEVN
jgi:hypothetical protein